MTDIAGVQSSAARSRSVTGTFTAALGANQARAASWLRTAWSALRLDPTWRWFMLGFALLMAGYLVGPRIADADQNEKCVGNITLPGPFGIHLNCDAPEFLALASEPAGLLKAKNYRQSRPGLILAAAALSTPLSLIVTPVARGTPREQDPERITDSFTRYLPAYLAYMLLNGGILLLSFHFFRKIAQRGGLDVRASMPIVVSVGLLIVTNDVAKAFVWSPHTQMFNILVPVMAVYASLRTWDGALAHRRFAAGMGLMVGFGVTAYGVFVVVLGCMAAAALLALWGIPATRRQTAINLIMLLALSALPTALWYLIVRAVTGEFFSAEINEEALVWMLRLWADGADALAAEWFSKLGQMLRYAAPQATALIALVLFPIW